MDFTAEFARIMQKAQLIALATSADNVPNVRVVNFYYDPANNLLYFASFNTCAKNAEIAKNSAVSFTTLTAGEDDIQHVRVHGAQAAQSKLTVYDLKEALVGKFPSYEEMIAQFGADLAVYEENM